MGKSSDAYMSHNLKLIYIDAHLTEKKDFFLLKIHLFIINYITN